MVKARRALAKAKRTHRAAKIKRARKNLRMRTNVHRRAATKVKQARAHQSSACAAGGGNTGGNTGGTDVLSANGLGTLLAILGAGSNGGVVPSLDLTQLTSLINVLYPGASSALDTSELTAIFDGFTSAAGLDQTGLTDLLSGLTGTGALDPSELLAVLSGVPLDPTQLTALVGSLTGLLGDLGSTGLSNPLDPTTLVAGLLSALTGGQSADPTQVLGTLLGLLAAAGNSGSIPSLNLTQFTSLLNGLYPGAGGALGSSELTSLLTQFPGAGSMDLTQLTGLLSGVSSLDPTSLLAVLNGASLSSSQLSALTSTITGLLNGVGGGTTFTNPANPLSTVATLLGNLLCGLLGGLLC